MKNGPVTRIYQLRIALRHTKPEIWRRVLVAGETTLATLHYIIQTAMGWENMHLHVFGVGDFEYSDPEMKVKRAKDERSAKLFRIAPKKGDAFFYEYDFGDSWYHDVKVEAVSEGDDRYPGHPVCIGGAGACPPEDCGGVPGYEYLLKVVRDRKHPDYQYKVGRFGRRIDPEAFDIDLVSHGLAQVVTQAR
jgi:hypothetical protein